VWFGGSDDADVIGGEGEDLGADDEQAVALEAAADFPAAVDVEEFDGAVAVEVGVVDFDGEIAGRFDGLVADAVGIG